MYDCGVSKMKPELPEYLIPFDLSKMSKEYTDVLIIGSGIAGLYTAMNIRKDLNVIVLSKEELKECNTFKAQGGIAVAMDKGDDPSYHYEDTIKSGAGLCDTLSVDVLTKEGPKNIINLIRKANVDFDKREDGSISFTREGAHDRSRVIHYKDYTGKYVEEKLIEAVKAKKNIELKESVVTIDLIKKDEKVYGVLIYSNCTVSAIIANEVILATGGIGMIYRNSTNSYISTSDGIAMAYRSGAILKDMEFVQFHPTGFKLPDDTFFLISEAVRGEGAVLRNKQGEAFMSRYHELKDLATRDVVARAIFNEMQVNNTKNVDLDITFKDRDYLENRFEQIFATLLRNEIDMSKDMIPVVPVQHYFMGGIATDINGKTNIENLYAVGECSCTGIHGANRLASNSLLEALVFGSRIAKDINSKDIESLEYLDENIVYKKTGKKIQIDIADLSRKLQNICETKVGLLRNKEGLEDALNKLELIINEIIDCKPKERNEVEILNMYQTAYLITKSALLREESRGAHYRQDYPQRNDNDFRKHITHKFENGEMTNAKLDIN
jgi:L-aspartate oxidase